MGVKYKEESKNKKAEAAHSVILSAAVDDSGSRSINSYFLEKRELIGWILWHFVLRQNWITIGTEYCTPRNHLIYLLPVYQIILLPNNLPLCGTFFPIVSSGKMMVNTNSIGLHIHPIGKNGNEKCGKSPDLILNITVMISGSLNFLVKTR